MPTPTHPRWPALVLPWLVPLLASLLAWPLADWLPSANLALIYLAGVLLTAIYTRVRPALACALLSFLAYNFWHTEPRFSLQMFHREDILTAGLLVMVALVCGQLAARLNEQLSALRDSQSWSNRQMDCARALSSCVAADEVVNRFMEQVQACLGWTCRLQDDATRLPDGDGGIGWCQHEQGILIGFQDGQGNALAVSLAAQSALKARDRERLEALLDLTRLAWGRVRLAERLRQETLVKEREQLRSALLSSISHDLRTPLATMIGSVSSLIDLHAALSPEQRAELLANTLSEAQRLDRYIQKLLDMTRLGHGELTLDRDWVGVDDIVSVVIKRSRALLGDRHLELSLTAELPLLHVHPALIEQALFNVLENAIRFSPSGAVIRLQASSEPGWLHIDVSDAGPGIDAADHERVFDMFHTFSYGDQYAAGTGLGLAICRSILAAHGGSSRVLSSAPGQGTTMRLSVPLSGVPASVED